MAVQIAWAAYNDSSQIQHCTALKFCLVELKPLNIYNFDTFFFRSFCVLILMWLGRRKTKLFFNEITRTRTHFFLKEDYVKYSPIYRITEWITEHIFDVLLLHWCHIVFFWVKNWNNQSQHSTNLTEAFIYFSILTKGKPFQYDCFWISLLWLSLELTLCINLQ